MNVMKDGYQKWFVNYKVKLFSLICALFLWFFVSTDNTFEHTLHVPLRVLNLPPGWILTRPVPDNVAVHFRGSGKAFLSSLYRNKRIELDLQEDKQPRILPITLELLKGVPPRPNGIVPLHIVEPDSVYIEVDQFAERKVPVQSAIELNPMDGYILVGSVVLNPDSIIIRGPRSLVNAVDTVPTQAVTYTHLLRKIKDKIPLATSESATLQYTVSTVEFSANIQRIGEIVMSGIPIQVVRVPRGLSVIPVPSSLTIKLQGGVDLLAQLKKEDIIATIDYRNRNRYQGRRIPATIQVPPEVSFSDVKPPNFELIVER